MQTEPRQPYLRVLELFHLDLCMRIRTQAVLYAKREWRMQVSGQTENRAETKNPHIDYIITMPTYSDNRLSVYLCPYACTLYIIPPAKIPKQIWSYIHWLPWTSHSPRDHFRYDAEEELHSSETYCPRSTAPTPACVLTEPPWAILSPKVWLLFASIFD